MLASAPDATTPSCEVVLLKLRHARRAIEGRDLWSDLALDVAPGDRLAVRGPSGAGKTVLLRALAGLDALDAGTLTLDGRTPEDDMPRWRAAVRYVHQRPVLLPGTVRDNLARPFALAIHADRAFDEQAARDWLTRLDRDPALLDRDATVISGGEQQVVALLRAVLPGARVLLLDEPTASLDPAATGLVEDLVAAWLAGDADRAVVWTSHDPAQLDRVTDRTLDLGAP